MRSRAGWTFCRCRGAASRSKKSEFGVPRALSVLMRTGQSPWHTTRNFRFHFYFDEALVAQHALSQREFRVQGKLFQQRNPAVALAGTVDVEVAKAFPIHVA